MKSSGGWKRILSRAYTHLLALLMRAGECSSKTVVEGWPRAFSKSSSKINKLSGWINRVCCEEGGQGGDRIKIVL